MSPILANSVMDRRRANQRYYGLPGRGTCAHLHGYVHSSGKARGRRCRMGKKCKMLVQHLYPLSPLADDLRCYDWCFTSFLEALLD